MRVLPFSFFSLVLGFRPSPISITPITDVTSGLRHCDFEVSTSPIEDGNGDFSFREVPGLSGSSGTFSYQSLNYPDHYLCPIPSHGGLVGIGIPGDAIACADAADATWVKQPGLTSPTNSSLTSASASPLFAGLFLTRNATSRCACCGGGWFNVVLAPRGAGTTQTWILGAPPPPPPPPPAALTVHAGAVDHRIKEEFNGCHTDPGYTQEPLGWNADLVYGNAFQGSPASKLPAWVDASTAAGTAALDPATHVNPSRPVPSLAVTFTGGAGVVGWGNLGIGAEGLALSPLPYEGFSMVLAPAGATIYAGLWDRNANRSLASAAIPVPASADWQRVDFSLTPAAGAGCATIAPGSDPSIDCGNMGPNPGHACVRCGGMFVVGLAAPGAAHIGYSSVFPGDWGRFAGLPVLKSAIDAMKQMGIKVIRQGGTVSQSFAWKEWRGPPWLRASMGHTWGDSLVGNWGLFEFIDMCNAADIKPVVTLAYDTNKAADWADLIEYMYGNETTTWGAQRAADGHPAPYFLDTMELGKCVARGGPPPARFAALTPLPHPHPLPCQRAREPRFRGTTRRHRGAPRGGGRARSLLHVPHQWRRQRGNRRTNHRNSA
jgi:hypothetical protein